jgi:ribosomal protein L17
MKLFKKEKIKTTEDKLRELRELVKSIDEATKKNFYLEFLDENRHNIKSIDYTISYGKLGLFIEFK